MSDRGYRGYQGDGPHPPGMPSTAPKRSWSVSGTLSTPNATAITPDLEVGLQETFPEPGPYTLQFDLIPPAGPRFTGIGPIPKIPRAEAVIEWSVAGNKNTRTISVFSGTTISGAAEAVRCVVKDASIDVAGEPAVEYTIRVTLVRGVRPTSFSSPILVTQETVNVATGSAINVDIPQDAGINAVMVVAGNFLVGAAQADLTYKDVLVEQQDAASNTLLDWKPTVNQWVPLMPGAYQILLACTRVAGTVNFTVIFGVDG